jgi:hypothetical protein
MAFVVYAGFIIADWDDYTCDLPMNAWYLVSTIILSFFSVHVTAYLCD